MYTTLLGLSKEPFQLTPDPALLFPSETHREALAGLRYSILSKKGFSLLTGDAGTGKTTILLKLMSSLPPEVKSALIVNPSVQPNELLELVLLELGIKEIPESKARRVKMLEEFLAVADERGEVVAILIDEAHKLSQPVLEELRLLGNIERPDRKLLQIVLAGQTELREVLNQQELRQLKQRIAVRLSLETLTLAQITEYVETRWISAGGARPHPFSPEALQAVTRHSRGIPRVVNTICDNALMMMLAEGKEIVDAGLVHAVCHDLDLLEKPSAEKERRPADDPSAAAPVVSVPPTPVRQTAANGAAQALETGPIRAVATVEPVDLEIPFRTLQRYGAPAARVTPKPSMFRRFASILGFVN